MPIQVPCASAPRSRPSNSQCGASGHLRHSTRTGRGMRRGYVGRVSAMTLPTYDDIRRARELVAPHVRRTPVMEIEIDGRPVALKLELLQHAGSFKVRGA